MANELITANTDPATEIDQDELRKASEAFGVPYVDPAEEARARKRFESPDMNDPGFVTSIKSGVGQQASALARAAKDMPLIGGSGAVDALKRWGERTQENNPTVVHSLQDVVDHPVDTFKEGAGNAVAQMPANVGGGMAGRVIGGVIGARFGNAALGQKLGSWVGMGLPTLAQEYGGIRQEQDQEVAEGNLEADDKLQALKGAAPAAAIEFGLGPQRAIGHIIGEGFEGSAKDLAKKLATETAGMSAKDATRHVVKSAAKEIGRQGVEEGAEELVQNPLEAWGAHKDPLSAETIDQSLTGAALGLAGGVVLGAPTTAIQHHTAKTMVDNGQVTPDAPIAPPVTPSGPLGQAAAAGQAATPPAPEIPAAPVDPLAERIAAMAPTMESRDLLRQMRSDPRYGQETVTDALHAWAIGRNPNLDPKTRERALDSLQQLFGKDNFNMGQAATDDAIPGEAQRVPDVPQQGLLDAPTENGMPPFDPFQDTPPLPSVPATPSALSAPSVASSHSLPVLPVSAGDDGLPSVPSQASTQATENADPSPSVKTDISAPSVDDGMDDKVLSAFNDVFGEEDRAPAQTVADPQAEIDARIAEARAEEQRTAARNLIRDRVAHGFTAIENRALVNPKTGETHALNNPAEIMVAQTAIRRAIDEAAHSAATSDQNDLAQPSEAQKIAGNYAKGHLEWNGLNLAIENPKGSNRSGVDPNGQAWSVTMPAHYGYVKKTLGADGDQVDVYLGNAAHSNKVYVVDQIDADTGKFDEHKAIGNVRSLSEATALYDSGFSDGRGAQRRGAITEMTGEQFRDWVKNGDTTKPLAYSAPTANSQERKESHRPRLGESVASVWAGIKAANGGVVVDGKILYPAIKVPGMAGTFRMANDFTLEKLVDGGKGTVKASPEENRDIDDAVEKDQAEVVVLSRWGYSGDKNGRQTVVQVLHSPAGNSYQPLTNPTQPEETHVQKAPEAVQAEAQGSEQQQSAGAQLTLAGTEDAALRRLQETTVRFASGMSAISDLSAGGMARAGHQNSGIGVDVGLLSKNGINALANAIAEKKVKVFIDSGAFSNFRKSLKSEGVSPLDFDSIMAKYDAIEEAIAAANPAEEDYPRPMLVMPDVVGDQAASLALVEKYKAWIAAETQGNLSVPIVPVQKGALSLEQAYRQVVATLGSDNFVVGLPSNAEAISREELAVFLGAAKPPRVHFLGAASAVKLDPLLAIVAQHSPDTQVTADASQVRNTILRNVKNGMSREDAITAALHDKMDPLIATFYAVEDTPPTDGNTTEKDTGKAEPAGQKSLPFGIEIKSFKHTKTGDQLFSVVLPVRTSTPHYQTINRAAIKHGGKYSSFKGAGAIPGFHFNTEEKARSFSNDATLAEVMSHYIKPAAVESKAMSANMPGLPSYLASMPQGQRDTYGLDALIESAPNLHTNNVISDARRPDGTAYTPEMAMHGLLGTREGMERRNGQLLAKVANGSTTGELIEAWKRVKMAENDIAASRKESPEMWAGYDARQSVIDGMKTGDSVLDPYASTEHPYGQPATIVQKFSKNWKVRLHDGSEKLYPAQALRPYSVLAKAGTGLVDEYGENAWRIDSDLIDDDAIGSQRVTINANMLSERQQSVSLDEIKRRIADDAKFRSQFQTGNNGSSNLIPAAQQLGKIEFASVGDTKAADPLTDAGFKLVGGGNTWAKTVPNEGGSTLFNVRRFRQYEDSPFQYRLTSSARFDNGITGAPTQQQGVFDTMDEVVAAVEKLVKAKAPAAETAEETPIWQMTRAEYWRSLPASANGAVPVEKANSAPMARHEIAVRDRLIEGKPVPANVRADYPNILDDGSSKPAQFSGNKIFTADKVAAAEVPAPVTIEEKPAPAPAEVAKPEETAPAPAKSESKPDRWSATDLQTILALLDQGRIVLVADGGELGIPTIQDMPSDATKHMGFGTFRTETDAYDANWDGGGAMQRTPDGQIGYTVVNMARGTLPTSLYDPEAIKATLRAKLAETQPADNQAATPADYQNVLIKSGSVVTTKGGESYRVRNDYSEGNRKSGDAVSVRTEGYAARVLEIPYSEVQPSETTTATDDVDAAVLQAFESVFDEPEAAPAPAPDKFSSSGGDTLNDAERQLREAAHAEDRPGDVLLGNGRYVDFATAVRLAREGIESGAFKAAPEQLHFKLDLAMRDVDRVLEAAAKPLPMAKPAAPQAREDRMALRLRLIDEGFIRYLEARGMNAKVTGKTREDMDAAYRETAEFKKIIADTSDASEEAKAAKDQKKLGRAIDKRAQKEEADYWEAAAARMEVVKIEGSDEYIVREPRREGGYQNFARFGISPTGKPSKLTYFFESESNRIPAGIVAKRFAELNRPLPTAGKAATSAAKNTVMGLADVAKGLSALFKPKPGTLGSGPFIFNEDTYAAAKPYFAAGLSHFRQAGADVVAMATALIKSLRDQFGMDRDTVKEMLPYITQYMRDVQSGKIDYSEVENGGANESDPSTDESAGNGEVPPLGADGNAETSGTGSRAGNQSAQGNSSGVGGLSPGNDGRAKQGGNRGTVRGRVPGEDVGGAGAVSGGGDALAGQQGAGLPGMADDVSAGAAGGTGSGRRGLGNYHIADPEALIGGSPRVRFERNKAAIETYQNVKAEGRAPTAAERDAIARFIGWGSFGQELFQGTWEHPKPKPEWRDADAWLREHMGRAEWESAQASIINAHYTDPPTVTAMWDMVRQMGFTGGRVLEPSMGIGNFYGLMPRDLMEKSQLTGIEMETMTGEMAQMLYPDANIQIKPYQDSKTADGFYDLVIGNWPFAADAPLDRRYRRLSPTLHDFFFLKALDQTRAGGLVVGITSSGTMDKVGESTRLALAHKADLIAAIRLPSGAFEKYAGTSVVTDILVFQKRENDNPNAGMEPWVKTREIDTPEGSKIRVNAYFADNPGRVLGTLNYGHGTTRGVPGMIVDRPADLMERLQALPAMLPADTYAPAARGKHLSFIANHTNDRQQSVTIGADNGLYVVNGEHLTPILEEHDYRLKDAKKTAAREAQLRSLIGLRRSYADLIQKERTAPEQAEAARKALNKLYKAFVKEHGFINASDGMKILKKIGDPFHPSLAALEIKNGSEYRPAAILSRPTMRGAAALDNPSVRDAFVLARNQSMNLDMEAIAKAAHVPVEQAIEELTQSGAVFRTPAGNYEVADVYLSGNVRVKLHEAEAAQADGIDMAANIAALREVIPPDVPYYRIEAKLGAPWVPVPQYVNFIAEMLGVSPENAKAIKVENRMGRWNVAFDDPSFNRRPEAQTVHGVPFYAFHKILRAAMNNLSITIRERDSDGREFVNEVATAEVNAKATAIRENFSSWIWSDIDRRMALEKDYNEVMRAVAAPHFDGSFLALEGMALQRGDSDFNLRQHQMNAIWRGLVNQCGIYAHEVGPQPLDAKILTPSGWTTMGEVKPGMMVVAADGTPTAVEAIYPKGEKTVYRVIFSDGSSTECCDDHLWLTSTYAERNYAARQGDKDWPCATPKVRPLHEIRQELRAPHLSAKNHRIPIVSPVQFAERPLALAPYLLGALLGDGGLSGRGVVLTTADSEIADACRLHLPAGAKMERVKATGRCATWTLTSADAVGRNANGCINPVKDAIDALALRGKSSHDKFIPDDYLFNTIENRIELLRGLMDTDGSVAKGGHSVYFYTTSARLKDGVVALVQSLGGTVSVREKRPTYTHLGEKRAGRLCYVLCLKLPATVNPFRLPRKASAVVSKTSYAPARYIVDVQPVGTKPVQCIRVAHPDHLYVTDDFIVTHNTGKTYTMGGLAVESRRYGLAKKPLIFAHNANSSAVVREIQEMYPAAKLLYVDNLSPDNINVTLRQIANDDWDAVVVPHSLISRFSLTQETLTEIAREEIAALEEEAIIASQEENSPITVEMMDDEEQMRRVRSPTAKELVRARNLILARISSMAMAASKEGAIPFEELGVDMIIVDEAHAFKKPPLTTRMRMKGLNKGVSVQSIAMRFLTDYVKKQNSGKGVHLFTGTPITNTLTEIYNLQRYVADPQMQRDGVKDWDSWFSTFADSMTDVELTSTGEYEAVTRLSAFINTADLRNMIGAYTDIVFADDMPEFAPRPTSTGKVLSDEGLTDDERDELLNGKNPAPIGRPYKKIVNDVAAMTPEQASILENLQSLARSFKNSTPLERKRRSSGGHISAPLYIETSAPAAGLDPRLYDIDAPDHPDLKVNRVTRNVLHHYNEDKLATQVVFVERGYTDWTERNARTPDGWTQKDADNKSIKEKAATFNLVKDMVDKMVDGGIPRNEIAVIQGTTSQAKRLETAAAMNEGRIRVVIGLTSTLGIGVNMQKHLRAMHHMDAPWMPGDLEQRNGRGQRQGNEWNTIYEYRYITDRVDGRRWQVLAVKDRFIKQFLKADADTRIIEGDAVSDEDDSDIMSSLSEAAGDPRILLRQRYKAEVEKLDHRLYMHDQGRTDSKRRAQTLSDEIGRIKRTAADIAEDIAHAAAMREKGAFSITIEGKEYTVRHEADAAIKAFVEAMEPRTQAYKIGKIGDFSLSFSLSFQNAPLVGLMRGPSGQEYYIKASTSSIESILRNLPDHLAKMEKDIADKEKSIPRLIESANAPFPRADDLARKKLLLAQLDADLQTNPVPPPPWLRQGAPNQTLIYVGNKPFEVEGHQYAKDGYFVLVKTPAGSRRVPYSYAKDEFGMDLYEEHQFTAPPEAVRTFQPNDEVIAADGDHWKILRQPHVQDNVQIVLAQHIGSSRTEEIQTAGLRHVELPPFPPIPLLDLAEVAAPKIEPASDSRMTQDQEIGQSEFEEAAMTGALPGEARFSANSGEASISPADKAVYGMVAEGKGTHAVLKFIASASRTPFNRELARLLLQTGINPALTLSDTKGWKFAAGQDKKYSAAYNPKTDTASLFRVPSAERHLLHELVHAATLQALTKKGMAAVKLRALFASVKKSGKLKGMYGMSDVDEFIAEAFTNPFFQQKLKGVRVNEGAGKVQSAWQWFVRIVRSILGLKPGQENALSAVMELGVGVMRENMALNKAADGKVRYADYTVVHELRHSDTNRALDGAELQTLRRAAAGLERPKDGVFLRVTADGFAIGTGPKGARIPESFRRFAANHRLTFRAERRIPNYAPGRPAYSGAHVTTKTEPMPISYRQDGALYFGEQPGGALDRTSRTRFNIIEESASGTRPADDYENKPTPLTPERLPPTIRVDGVSRPTMNSEGRQIHPSREGVENFWRWFDGVRPEGLGEASQSSKDASGLFGADHGTTRGLDANGRPRVFFHGTADAVDAFDLKHPKRKDSGWLGRGVYLTTDTDLAESYANFKGQHQDQTIMPLYAAIRNPFYATLALKKRLSKATQAQIDVVTNNLIKAGFDGVVLEFNDDTAEVVAFSPEQVKSASGNSGGFDPSDDRIRYSSAADPSSINGEPAVERWSDIIHSPDVMKSLRQQIADQFATQQTFNWWHKTVGSQFHKAKIDTLPGKAAGDLGTFGAVVDQAQQYLDTTSRLAAEAADFAPGLLPKTNGLVDAWRGIKNMRTDARDAQAIAGPVFHGTLADKVFTDSELRNPPDDAFGKPLFAPLTDRQIELYRQYRATIDRSLDDLAVSEMARLSHQAQMQQAPSGLSLRDAVEFYRQQYADALDDARDHLKETQSNHADELRMLESAAEDGAAGADERNKYANLREKMKARHAAELNAAEKTLASLEEIEKGIVGRAAAVEKLKQQGYSPLMRFGQYTVDVIYQDDKGNPIKDTDGNDMRPFFGMYESEAMANKVARALKAEYPGATIKQGVMAQNAAAMFKGVTPETLEVFGKLMGAEQDEAFQNYLKLAVNNRSAMKRLIHRMGIHGFNEDPTRVLASFVTSNARAASGNYHLGAMLRATAAIPQHKGDVKDEAVKLMNYLQNPAEEGAWVRSVLFANFLGGSVASAMVNLTQTFTTTIPYLHQFGGNATKNVLSAMKLAAGRMRSNKKSTGDPDLDKALQRAEEEGIVAPHEIHMLQGEATRSGVLTGNRFTRNLMKAWGSMFSMAEAYNREVAFIASYKVAQAKGMRGNDAYLFAGDAVSQTQFQYSKASRANWGRGPVGATLMTFKTFTVNYLEFLKRLPPKERALALAVIFVAAGAQGLPFADDLDDLLDTIMQTLGFSWNTKQQKRAAIASVLGEGAAGFIQYGVSYGLPLDLASRIGLSNLIPGSAIFKPSETNKTRDVAEFFGAAGGALQQAMNAFSQAQAGSFTQAGMTLVPKAIRDLGKGIDMAGKGYYTDTRGRRVADTNGIEAAAKFIGFQPTVIAEDSRARSIVMDQSMLYRSVQGQIHSLWAEGLIEGDPDKVQKAQARLNAWNEDNPESRMLVSRGAILRRVRQARLTADQRLINTAPKMMRQQLRPTLEGEY